ncbi:hypothetical protein BOX15_Mlig004155g2, partial [Macrostomum lignano]
PHKSMRNCIIFCGGSGSNPASFCPVNGCLFTLATGSVLLSLVAMLHGYLFCLPFSQFVYPLELDFNRLVLELESTPTASSVSWAVPINNKNFPALHPNSNRCANFEVGEGSKYRLLMLIKSALPNFAFRQALRATWANEINTATVQIGYAFVLGGTHNSTAQAAVDREQITYGDLIQQAFVDAYFNNTYKLMFAIDWAAASCPGADFILFADDDYYVSTYNLVNLLGQLQANGYTADSLLVTGHVFSSPVPKRNLFNKWYTSLAEYPYTFWPPYPTGARFWCPIGCASSSAWLSDMSGTSGLTTCS